ncbi:RloB family protein [Micromonospora sp. CB01531]|uniref:RloB family protein n=1 Tax=Micromonospora sp. CB01531 TaxID=1718947 RepID=UPI00093CA55F|nr:RloB family protein [Micromonospora sp. CB01531]
MGRDRQRRPTSLRRKVGIRRPRKTIAIFCEGERTEPEYLEALKREPAVRETAAVDLRIETQSYGSVPLTLVRMAIDAKDRATREEGEIDEFWCVFDVEWPRNHPGLRDALELADRNEINLAISNPCFELWLILHFRNHAAWLDNDAARRLRRSLDGQLDKGLKAANYMANRQVAAHRAAALDRRHVGDGTVFPQNNPSSGMHRLILATTTPGS